MASKNRPYSFTRRGFIELTSSAIFSTSLSRDVSGADSGLFDEYLRLKLILGHLGEAIPFNIWRVDHRIKMGTNAPKPKASKPIGHYLRENFYITTSGNFARKP